MIHAPLGNWIRTDGAACIRLVQPYELSAYWEVAAHWLEQISEYWQDYYDLPDMYVKLFEGTFQLWLVGQDEEAFGCFISEIREFPKARVFVMILAAAEHDNIDKLSAGDFFHEHMMLWAKSRGCKFSRIEGREAWKRIGKALGYDLFRVTMVKSLEKVWRH